MAISDIGTRLSQQFLLAEVRERIDRTQTKINTGKESTRFSGYESDRVLQSLSFRSTYNVLETYQNNINTARSRIDVMDKAIGEISKAAVELRSFLQTLLQETDPQTGIITGEGNEQLQRMLAKVNVKLGDRYLFAGDDINNAPYANAATLTTNMQTAITDTYALGSPTAADVLTFARSYSGTALGYSTTLMTAGNVSLRADESTDVDYTVLGNNAGFADAIRAASLIANMTEPTNAAEQARFWVVINGAIQMLDDSVASLAETQGALGTKARRMDSLLSNHNQLQLDMEGFIGKAEDADLARAAIDIEMLKVQLEASYRVVSDVSRLKLVNYL
jgi:flagellar hook-associated protein 3 FlgL